MSSRRALEIAPRRTAAVQNIQAIIARVEAGHGVAALPGFVVPACARYDVSVQKLVDPVVLVESFAVMKGRLKTTLVSTLVDALGAQFRDLAKQVG